MNLEIRLYPMTMCLLQNSQTVLEGLVHEEAISFPHSQRPTHTCKGVAQV